jgi:hypothetical protein
MEVINSVLDSLANNNWYGTGVDISTAIATGNFLWYLRSDLGVVSKLFLTKLLQINFFIGYRDGSIHKPYGSRCDV